MTSNATFLAGAIGFAFVLVFVFDFSLAVCRLQLRRLTIQCSYEKMNSAIQRSTPRGPVAQLGARFHGMEEVVGSIPTRSTISFL
jgi:hypothetical protein